MLHCDSASQIRINLRILKVYMIFTYFVVVLPTVFSFSSSPLSFVLKGTTCRSINTNAKHECFFPPPNNLQYRGKAGFYLSWGSFLSKIKPMKRSKCQVMAGMQGDTTEDKNKKEKNEPEIDLKLENLSLEDVNSRLEKKDVKDANKGKKGKEEEEEQEGEGLFLNQLREEKQKITRFESALQSANLLPSQIRHALFPDIDGKEEATFDTKVPRRGITYLDTKTQKNISNKDEGNEITISLSKENTIHVTKDEQCPFPNWVDSSFYTSKAPWYLQLALKTLHEERFGKNPILASYIAMLPSNSEDFSTLYHWTDDELERYIKYQPLIEKVRNQREKWNELIDTLFLSCKYNEKQFEQETKENMGGTIDEYAYEYELESSQSGVPIQELKEDKAKNRIREAISTANPNRMLSGGITRSAIIASIENVLSRSFQGKFGLGIKSVFPSLLITLTLGFMYAFSPEVSIRFLYALDDYPWLPLLGLPILFLPAYLEYNAKEEYVMAPLIDSFNHKTRARSFLDFSSVNQQLVLKVQPTTTITEPNQSNLNEYVNDKVTSGNTKKATPASTAVAAVLGDFQGDPTKELFISYGRKTNDELLQFFGFVESDNPVDTFIFDNVVDKLQKQFSLDTERIVKLKSKDLFNVVNKLTFERKNKKIILQNKQPVIRGLRLLFSSEEEFFQDEELEDKIVQSPMALTVSNFEESPFDVINDDSDTQRRLEEGIKFLIDEELNRLQDDNKSNMIDTGKKDYKIDADSKIESNANKERMAIVAENRLRLGQKFRKEKSRLLSMIKAKSQKILSMSSIE